MADDATSEVEVSRLTLASAIDLLDDYRQDMERAEARGPYLDELSSTVEQLEKRLHEE